MLARPLIRKFLNDAFPTDPDLHAFCLDFCGETASRFTSGMDRRQRINLLFELHQDEDLFARLERWATAAGRVLPTFNPHTKGEGRSSDDDAPDEPLLKRVKTACRMRESPRQVEIELLLNTRSLRLCEVRFHEGRVPVHYGLGVTTQIVDRSLLDQFEAALHTYCLDTRGCGLPRLIYRALPPLMQIEDDAARRSIDLKSLDDYESLVDLTAARRNQAQRLSTDPRYQAGLYVGQHMKFGNGNQLRLDQTSTHALETLARWIQTPGSRCVLILGEFGTGKTFLLYELARHLQQPDSKQVPLLCNLREIEKAQEIDTLLVQHMQREHITPIVPQSLRHMIELGRVILLFDGFDEMALRTDYERAVHHLEALLTAVTPGTDAKLILTSRTSHFLTDNEVATVLGQKLALVPVTAAQLQPFTSEQIERFLENKLGSRAAARARSVLMAKVEDLSGLAQNPRMLNMIAEIDEFRLEETSQRLGTVTEADLYQLLIEQWLDAEVRRKAERATGKVLDRARLHRAATHLALMLWRQISPTLSLDDLREAVRASQPPSDLDIEIAAQQMGSSSLLVRAGEAAFTFLHASIGEFLVARAAADELQAGQSTLLLEGPLGRLATKFLIGCLRPCSAEGPVAKWAERLLVEEDAPSPVAKGNALQVFIELDLKPPTAINLSGQDLSGKDLSTVSLRGANLKRAILRSATLVERDLRRALLAGADLTDADLRRANLQEADLRHAILVGANLLGADLRNAKLKGADFHRAKLIAAQVDEVELSHSHLGGAALPSERPEPKLHDNHINNRQRTAVRSVTFSPDGTILASGTDSGTVRPWSSRECRPIERWAGHGDVISSTAFSPNGGFLASGSWDGTIRLWNVTKGEEVRMWAGHNREVTSVVFSPDGRTLSSGSKDCTVRLWIRDSDATPEVLTGHRDEVTGVAFSPDGRLLASSSLDGTIRLWAMIIGEQPCTIRKDATGLTCLAFSPKGGLLASGTIDGLVHFHEVSNPKTYRVAGPSRGTVTCVSFSPDGSVLASGSRDGSVQLWNLSGDASEPTLRGHHKEVSSVTFSPSGRILVSGSLDGTLRLWRVEDGACLAVMTALNHNWVAFTPAGQYKMGGDAGELAQWFWHEAGQCHFAPGTLDEIIPELRLPDDHCFC